MESRYLYNFRFLPDRGEWLGTVYDGGTVVAVGCEATEADIRTWLEKAIKLEPWVYGNPAVPDLPDRRVGAPQTDGNARRRPRYFRGANVIDLMTVRASRQAGSSRTS